MNGMQRQPADVLGAAGAVGRSSTSTSSTARSACERRLVVAGGVEHVVAIERVGEIFADEVAEELLPDRLRARLRGRARCPSDSPRRIRASTGSRRCRPGPPRALR